MDSEVGKSQTVVELKAIAKQLGLKRYSRLRKAELIQFIRQNRPPPPVPCQSHVNKSKAILDLELPKVDQDLVKVPNVKPYQMKPKQTRRQKREEKNFEMQSPVIPVVNDKPRDKQIKRIKKKLQKVNKKIKNNKKQKNTPLL